MGLARLTSELLILVEATLGMAIPRPNHKSEQVTFEFRYALKPLSLDPDTRDVFFFEVLKPTRYLEVCLHPESGLFVEEPTVKRGDIEELLLHGLDTEAENSFSSEMLGAHGRKLSRNYPRSGRYAVFLNAMLQDKVVAAPLST